MVAVETPVTRLPYRDRPYRRRRKQMQNNNKVSMDSSWLQDDPEPCPCSTSTEGEMSPPGDNIHSEEEINAAINEIDDRIWYDRHKVLREKVQVDEGSAEVEIRKKADKAARRIEAKYGKSNLGPYSDFEWGITNGKLSALRWVLGDQWDLLDT
jgi:hypothetical protein